VGKSTNVTTKRAPYISAEKVLTAFNSVYPELKENIDIITLTGAGEPTLNSDLAAIISGIKKIAVHPVAILTNSTLIGDSGVADALLTSDIVILSLDAVIQSVFEHVDRPAPKMQIDEIINAIMEFSHKFTGKLYLELLLVKDVNDSIEDIQKFADVAKKIRYTKVQLGTVFRPPAWEGAERLTDDELYAVYEFLTAEGLEVAPVKIAEIKSVQKNLPEQLINMLRMRPLTIRDIISSTGLSENEIKRFIAANKVKEKKHDGEIYYSLK